MSDLIRFSDFENTGLYNEAYREWGCNHLCELSIKTGDERYLAVHVHRAGHDYTDNEKDRMAALGPYLYAAFHRQLDIEKLGMAFETRKRNLANESMFWCSLVSQLFIKNASWNATKVMRSVFPETSPGYYLPDKLKNRLAGIVSLWDSSDRPINKRNVELEVPFSDGVLVLNFKQDSLQSYKLTGFLKDAALESIPDNGSGTVPEFSKRELEILHWVRAGKTNPEIAILVGLSLKSIERYLSLLLEKTDAVNRTDLIIQLQDPVR